MLLNVLLDFLFQFIRTLRTLYKNDRSLYDLTSYGIGSSAYAAFQNIGEFHDNAFDLERPDTIARRLDNVVNSADIPVIAVLVFPCGIARMVDVVVPCFFGLFVVVVVTEEKSGRRIFISADNDLARFAGFNGISVGIDYIYIVLNIWLAHRAGTSRHAHEIADNKGSFGLTKSLHKLHARSFEELIVNFGIKRFACNSRIFYAAEIVF